MKHIDYRIERLLHEGFSIGTLERFSSKQIQVLYEKVKKDKKKEVKEQPKPVEKTVQQKVIELPSGAKTALGSATVSNEGGKTVITTTATEGELEEDMEDPMDFEKGQRTQDPKQVGPGTDDGQDDYGDGMPTEGYLEEKSVSKQQQKIMGLALSVKKGDTPKSKVSKKVQKMAKEMSKKDLEDFARTKHKGLPTKVEEDNIKKIEESILRLVQNHIPPHTTKKELINYISKKR